MGARPQLLLDVGVLDEGGVGVGGHGEGCVGLSWRRRGRRDPGLRSVVSGLGGRAHGYKSTARLTRATVIIFGVGCKRGRQLTNNRVLAS